MYAFHHVEFLGLVGSTKLSEKKKKKKSTKKSKPQSSWTLKIAEVQEVACVLQLS